MGFWSSVRDHAHDAGNRAKNWFKDAKDFFRNHDHHHSSTTSASSPSRTAATSYTRVTEATSSMILSSTPHAAHTIASPLLPSDSLSTTLVAVPTTTIDSSLLSSLSAPGSMGGVMPAPTSVAAPESTQGKVRSQGPNVSAIIVTTVIITTMVVSIMFLVAPIVTRFVIFCGNASRMWYRSGTAYGSFERDSEMGFDSENFSLANNIDGGDARSGLDRNGKVRILWYMFLYAENFDEARLRYVKYQFAKNGIGPDGQPLDPKFISY